jgi:hypothetical protein
MPHVPAVDALAASLDPAAADAVLAALDRRMAWIDRASLPEEVLPLGSFPHRPGLDDEIAAGSSLVRKSIRSLYLTGRFLDMPEEMKMHPGTQERVRAMQQEMDDAVLGMTSRLERMTDADHRRLQDYLQRDDTFGERLARVLEQTASDDGLSFGRNHEMRREILALTKRMSAQSPSLVTDPLIDKVRRIEAHPRSDAEATRRLAAKIGEEAFWQHQERLAVIHAAWSQRLQTARAELATTGDPVPAAPDPNAALDPNGPQAAQPAASPPPQPPKSSPGANTMSTGGVILGFGGGSVGIGLIFAGLWALTQSTPLGITALVFGVTIGPILLVVGLIVVVAGAIMKASE